MVCDRCVKSVRKIFEDNLVYPVKVQLGEVVIKESLDSVSHATIGEALHNEGFNFIDNTKPILVTMIKSELVKLFSQPSIPEEFKLSTFLTERLPYDYSHLSRVFSHHEKDTIEHYLISLRVEKAKELLSYNDRNVSEVAYLLGYASAAHFSRQFKKKVGVSPSSYQSNPNSRKSLGEI